MKTSIGILKFCIAFLLCSTTSFGQKKYELSNKESLKAGQVLFSNNEQYQLIFRNNNLLIQKGLSVIWQSNRFGSWMNGVHTNKLIMDKGEIKCYFSNQLTWSSKTNFASSKLILDNDGILKIKSTDNKILWENHAFTSNSVKPPLVNGGDEGPFTDSMLPPSDKIKLYVTFVDWPDAKAEITSTDSLWNIVTSNGKLQRSLEEQGQAINFKVDVHLNRQWQTLPQPTSYYLPPATEEHLWNWQEYIKDCPALLSNAFGIDTFSNNSIAVFIANPAAGAKWKKIPDGNLPIRYKGLRYMISLTPSVFEEKYTTLMHEIGHCYGSGELYPVDPSKPETDEMAGMDIMGTSHVATAFIGYHRYRYGWMPFVKNTPRSIYLTNPRSYGVVLTPVSAKEGVSMVLIPDKKTKDLDAPNKLWGIEMGQAMQTQKQFFSGKDEKIFAEGDYILVYSVDAVEQPDKRAIRAISKTDELRIPDQRWRNVYLYKEGETFKNPDAPMEVKIYKNADGTFFLDIKIK